MERRSCRKGLRDWIHLRPGRKCTSSQRVVRSGATRREQSVIWCSRLRQRGTAIVEAVIALPILLVVILGSIQFGLIYEAKATLNHASLQAARAGAVSHAQPDAIRRGLARGLAPLYSPESSLQGFASTVARINAELLTDARIRILNPTREAFADFSEDVDGVREIPNDRLHVRSTAIGTQSGLNIQDANILKVEITYGYELKVPLVNWFISRVLLAVRRGGATADAFEQQLLRRTLLPIVATSTVRMQSPARMSDAIVARGDLPDLDRIPSDASPPPVIEDESGDDGAENGGDSNDGDGGSSLGEGFFGYGGGPADGSGGGSTPGNGGDGSGGGDESGGGGGNSGNPQICPVERGESEDGNAATTPSVMLPSLSVGNPIHVVTGNKYQAESDLAPLPGALGIVFARHYNSEAADHAGVMGAGWRHGYEASIRVSDDGASIDLWQADGRHLAFNRSDDSRIFAAQRAGDGEVRVEPGGYRWLWSTARELRFDSAGRLTSMREGVRLLTLQYNEAHQLIRIIDPQQRVLRIDYYANGRVSHVRSVAGAAWHYVYDEAGNLAQVISADGSVRRYEYEDEHHPHHLTGISSGTLRLDDYGNRSGFERIATWAYDARGRAVLSSHPDDAGKVTLQYGDGHTDVTDAFGRVTRYLTALRAGVALVTEVRGPGCGSCGRGDVSYRYNDHFQLTEVAEKYAPTLRYQYDDRQRLSQIERRLPGAANEWRVRYRYNGNVGQPTRIERPSVKRGAVSAIEMAYRPDGQLLSIRESGYTPGREGFVPIERTATFDYDAEGNLLSIDGPRNDVSDVTHFSYDAQGRPTAIRGADGIERRVSAYDPAGRPTHMERTGRPAIRLDYDAAGRVTRVTEVRAAGERAVQYGYDHLGRLQTIRRPDGSSRRIAYDAAGRPTRLIASDSGLETALMYAPDGNISHAAILSRHGVPVRVLHYAFDAQRRLKEVRDGDGPPLRQFTYLDDDSRPDRVTDPLGFETAFNYDTSGSIDSILAADGGVTRFTRDAAGRLVGVTAPNDARTRYVYDDFGRRVREDSADRGVTRYAYDDAGNLVEKTDARGEKTRFVHDAANRLTEVVRREGTTHLRYGHGHLTRISGPSSEERFSYNADGQLGTHTRTIAGRLFKTGYRYDAQGRLEIRTLPSGQRLRYHYAQNGSLQAITRERLLDEQLLVGSPESGTDKASVTPIDALGDFIYGNGLAANTSYDAADGRIERRTIRGVSTFEYKHDESGRIVRIRNGRNTRSYDYDAVGRLIAARTPSGRFSYEYDANGNRLSAMASLSAVPVPSAGEDASQTYTYAQHSNRLLAIQRPGKVSYRHDAAGNPTDIANRRYEYNSAGRLARLYIDNRLTAKYRYNLSGERISKTSFAGATPQTTLYIYEDHQLVAEADARGKVVREYLYLGQHPVAMLDRGVAYWIHTDHLGAPIAVTDKDQRVVWRAQYEPFGEAIVDEDPDGDAKRLSLNLRFPGQYADTESGTNYNLMRDYDPQSGRYSTSDPIGLNGGVNPFAYAGQNPVNAVDPLGLYLFAFDGTWINRSSGVLTNVELFRRYYDPTFEEVNSFYRAGLGTGDPNQSDFENSVDRVLGGAFGLGGQETIRLALRELDELIGKAGSNQFDGVIDIVGFSRGAAIARAFANEIYKGIDGGYYANSLRSNGTCRSLRIRFMGLFDTVGSFGIPGNSIDAGYDFSVDGRVGTVAHAVALNEHRAAFDLISIQDLEYSPNTTAYREERGFIGGHSDIGGGYSTGDLSDIALQWMYKKAVSAGVRMIPLGRDQLTISAPIIHDERSFPQDREIFYPNDPDWRPAACVGGSISCLFWQPPVTQRQMSAPQFQFPELEGMIRENPQPDAVRGTVDMQRYRSWLRNRGQL